MTGEKLKEELDQLSDQEIEARLAAAVWVDEKRAAVLHYLEEKKLGVKRRAIATIGDGSLRVLEFGRPWHGLWNGVSPDSKYTVATSESTSMAHVINNATEKLIANVLVDTRPREAKFTPDGKQVWVSSEVGGSISVIDASAWKALKKIRLHRA